MDHPILGLCVGTGEHIVLQRQPEGSSQDYRAFGPCSSEEAAALARFKGIDPKFILEMMDPVPHAQDRQIPPPAISAVPHVAVLMEEKLTAFGCFNSGGYALMHWCPKVLPRGSQWNVYPIESPREVD